MGLSYLHQRDVDSLKDELNKQYESKLSYDGDDEKALELRSMLTGTAPSIVKDVIDDIGYTVGEELSNPNLPRDYSERSSDELADILMQRLTGINKSHAAMAEYIRMKTNEAEENRQKTEAALKAREENVDQAMKQVKETTDKLADAVKQAADNNVDLKKYARDTFGVSFDEEPAEKQPVQPQAQQTMQQAAPEVAQASPQTEMPAPPPDMGGQPPQGNMGAGSPPPPDMSGQMSQGDMGAGSPPPPDMGGQPPAPTAPQDDGMFTPSQGMINAVSSPFGA